MIDKAAADVSGYMVIFVVVIVIICCTVVNKQLNARHIIIIS